MKEDMKKVLYYFALKYNGNFGEIYLSLATREKFDIDEFMRLKKDVHYPHVTILDDKYPNDLKSVECPPFVLFYEGNLNLIKDMTSAIKYDVLESGGRLISTVNPVQKDNGIEFDYIVVCENQEDLKDMLEHIKSKGLNFKNYDKKKKKEIER
ncbi:hypothetical protein LA327_10550 [Thomasclavelia ramosa]|uniref:hypothetical protein n=1 Tax=Thomasclavelia ramosa TaxID=1547 RepID=UPI00024A58AE|nr:hypothetical protein [Thomasclavelia ramosa]EHQ46780.1 hypothetical protein HMPREF0978_01085 [Coprobacillus sp. 8_2_54BFAA]UBH42936.1 hypothetical protein LA327_10550 [Thomasclavelia ramosa]